jgi:hypothetical protein
MDKFNQKKSHAYTKRFLQDNPGAPQAVQRGCTCPVAENNFDRGRSKDGVIQPDFATDPECPLHGIDVLLKMLKENDLRD